MSDTFARNSHSKDDYIKSTLRAVPFGQRVLLGLYLAITRLLPTAVVLYFVRRASKTNPEENFDRANERVALQLPERPNGKLYWMNSIGPGDSTANQALLSKILDSDPTANILVTTRTVSAQGIFSRWKNHPRVIRQLAPHDGLNISRRFLDHWKPSVAIFCERDLWPNMLTALRQRRVPTAVVNGQLDGRLLEDFGKLQDLGKWFLAHIDYIHFITEASANIANEVMRPDAIKFLGKNLKLNCEPLPSIPDLRAQLNAVWGGCQIFTAASVATGEVRIVLDAFLQAHTQNPKLRLILVPRWKEQSDDFVAATEEFGIEAPKRSAEGLPQKNNLVFIADSYGELGTWYEASFAAFIGDTFHNGAGHNVYEPIMKGIPVVAGGIGRLFKDDFEALVRSGFCLITPDIASLSQTIQRLATTKSNDKFSRLLENEDSIKNITDTIKMFSHINQ